MSAAEEQRLALLREYHLLDSAPEEDLRAVLRLVTALTGFASAGVNLIDDHHQCQILADDAPASRTAREDSMCAVRFLDGAVVHVEDAAADPVYAQNPWVDGRLARVRGYASVPLVTTGGTVLGTLCALDEETRRLDGDQLARLTDLAAVVMSLFERRREAHRLEELAVEAEEQRALLTIILEEAEARQELTDAVLDTIDVAVVACDPEGRLTMFNRAASEWHGAYPDASVAFAAQQSKYALHEADGSTPLDPQRIPLRRALVEGRVEGAELVISPQHRAPISATCSGRSLVRLDGTLLGAVVAMTDVTTDRAQRAELVRSNDDLEQFAAIAGHDLAAPLGVVSGYLELLVDERGDQLDDLARGWIATARGGVDRMQSLIASLLTYATSGGAVVAPVATDLGTVLDLALHDLGEQVARSGAEISASQLPLVQGDPVLLRQLLQNLVGNAVKHRVPGRPCRVRVGAAPAAGAGGFWEVFVADDGAGIPARSREAVFGMFTALEGTAHRGHGIGLATCRRIVERHGGAIRVEETPGGGATFVFTLPSASPLTGPVARAHTGPAPGAVRGRGRRGAGGAPSGGAAVVATTTPRDRQHP